MRRLFRIVVFCLFVVTFASAQTATVKRNVVLRAKASKTSKAIDTLTTPATLTLINPPPEVASCMSRRKMVKEDGSGPTTSRFGAQLASVWEIHPITRIEVKRNGQWVDLDNE